MRFIRLLRSLDRVRLEHGPIDLVCYEEIRSFMVPMKYGQRRESMSFAAAYAGIKAHIMSWCERYQIPYQGVGPGTVKKFATGSGVASKDQMILAAARSLGTCPVDDNAADALWVLQYAEALDRGDVSMETKTKKKRKREDKSVAS